MGAGFVSLTLALARAALVPPQRLSFRKWNFFFIFIKVVIINSTYSILADIPPNYPKRLAVGNYTHR